MENAPFIGLVLAGILAIPMNSIMIIVTSNIDATRVIAVPRSERRKTSAPEPAHEDPVHEEPG